MTTIFRLSYGHAILADVALAILLSGCASKVEIQKLRDKLERVEMTARASKRVARDALARSNGAWSLLEAQGDLLRRIAQALDSSPKGLAIESENQSGETPEKVYGTWSYSLPGLPKPTKIAIYRKDGAYMSQEKHSDGASRTQLLHFDRTYANGMKFRIPGSKDYFILRDGDLSIWDSRGKVVDCQTISSSKFGPIDHQ